MATICKKTNDPKTHILWNVWDLPLVRGSQGRWNFRLIFSAAFLAGALAPSSTRQQMTDAFQVVADNYRGFAGGALFFKFLAHNVMVSILVLISGVLSGIIPILPMRGEVAVANLEYRRFHVRSGPASLFERIRYVLREPRDLKLHASHFQARAGERRAPVEEIQLFDAAQWDLMAAEVRADTGKFVKTAWRRMIDRQTWWIVMAFNDTVQTVYPSDDNFQKFGPDVVTGGEFYEFVERVNRGLMEADTAGTNPGRGAQE